MDRPQLTLEHLERFERANELRLARADDKRRIKSGQLDAAVILRELPPQWANAKVFELLLAMHRVGRVKATKWLKIHNISPERRINTMPESQRFRLAAHIDAYALKRDRLRRQLEASS
jgi:hypothetical protein